jgi:hypothetical protein
VNRNGFAGGWALQVPSHVCSFPRGIQVGPGLGVRGVTDGFQKTSGVEPVRPVRRGMVPGLAAVSWGGASAVPRSRKAPLALDSHTTRKARGVTRWLTRTFRFRLNGMLIGA